LLSFFLFTLRKIAETKTRKSFHFANFEKKIKIQMIFCEK